MAFELRKEIAQTESLSSDKDLARAYLKLIKSGVLAPELKLATDDLGLGAEWLRSACVRSADRLLVREVEEYDAYVKARDHRNEIIEAVRASKESGRIQLWLNATSIVTLLLAPAVIAVVAILHFWFHWLPLHDYEGPAVVLIGIFFASIAIAVTRPANWALILTTKEARDAALLTGERRKSLVTAIRTRYLPSFARSLLNEERRSHFSHEYAVQRVIGLSELVDDSLHVWTGVASKLETTLKDAPAASIGIAGTRGSGKSALLRKYCLESSAQAPSSASDLCCLVSAPVNYNVPDFLLYMFETFCTLVLEKPLLASSAEPGQPLGRKITAYLQVGLYRLGFPRKEAKQRQKIREHAKANLKRIRLTQTRTSSWSISPRFFSGSGPQYSRQTSRTERSMNHPEIVSEFCKFVTEVAAHLHRKHSRVFIGVDELDKIGSAEQAQLFLNEIKGIFGIPHVYFILSVSDDALTAFDRRGLPVRSVIESCFDEVVKVQALSYIECRRLLYRRVIGLTEPYIAFCYCLSGGLPRELIRAARQVVSCGQQCLRGHDSPPLLATDISSKPLKTVWLREIVAEVIDEEVRKKSRAIYHLLTQANHGTEISDLSMTIQDVYESGEATTAAEALIPELSNVRSGQEPDAKKLQIELAGFYYFCITLRDTFDGSLSESKMRRSTETTRSSENFSMLAQARLSFAEDAYIAWRSISRFRESWNMQLIPPPDETRYDTQGYL